MDVLTGGTWAGGSGVGSQQWVSKVQVQWLHLVCDHLMAFDPALCY